MTSLKEFFLMESHSTHYTLEPTTNGTGRLLSWDTMKFGGSAEAEDAPDDVSYEVIAKGHIDQLVSKLPKEFAAVADEVRNTWATELGNGEAVWVGMRGNKPFVDITTTSGKDDRESDFDPTSYSDDNSNSYF